MGNAVFELKPAAFARAATLFAPATFARAYIDGCFEGIVPSRLFVDDPITPGAALLCRSFGFYVAGSAAPSALRRFIAEAPPEPGVFHELYGYVPVHTAWSQALLDDSPGALVRIGRREFKFGHAALPEDLYGCYRLPEAARIVPLDQRLAERVDAVLHLSIGAFWSGYDRFLSRGFGFCMLIGNAPASVAYAAGVSSRSANIEVFTSAAYRRRGLSALTSAVFVEHCLDCDLTATWDSAEANHPSIALARRLGFEEHLPFCLIGRQAGSALHLVPGRWYRADADETLDLKSVWRTA